MHLKNTLKHTKNIEMQIWVKYVKTKRLLSTVVKNKKVRNINIDM